MADDIFEQMAAGMIGRFLPLVGGRPVPSELHGALRRDEAGYWVVDVEGWHTSDEGPIPGAVVAVLRDATLLLTD